VSDMPPVSNGPLPENQTASYKAAKAAVIVLSVLIVMALAALVIGGISKMGGKNSRRTDPVSFQLPPGARILEMQSQPGRLILRVRDRSGEEIDLIDTQDGHLIAQIKSTPDPAKQGR
jgi:hypothetical protein